MNQSKKLEGKLKEKSQTEETEIPIDQPKKSSKKVSVKQQTKKEPYIWINRVWCKRCGICIEFCPTKVYEKDEQGYPKIAHLEKCTMCGLCTILCPDFAIVDDPEAKEYVIKQYMIMR